MKNLKLRHLIPIFGVKPLDKLTPQEDFIIVMYNLLVLTIIGIGLALFINKYIL